MFTSAILVGALVLFAAAMATAVAVKTFHHERHGREDLRLCRPPGRAGARRDGRPVRARREIEADEFCLSCHVMEQYGKSLHIDDRSYIPAVHYQNHLVPSDRACFTCHTSYTLFGDYKAKLKGLRHVYVQYVGTIPTHIKLYEPYSNRECLHCHLGARSFEEGAMHNVDPATLPAVKANKLSCISAGCHEAAHDVANLSKQTFWPEVAK